MVATISKAATADYYIHSQASFRPPGEYYLSGEEPDGSWWNPEGLFASEETKSENGETIDSADFYRLYRGLDPRTGDKLTRNADTEKRCPAYDITFNADKSISALWAIAPAELREILEQAHNEAVRVALEDTIQANCSYTRVQGHDRSIKIAPADMMAGLFQHGASRANDPHLHTHCVILNLAKTHHDGKWRALHGNPLFSWQKAAGATYRAELAWLLRDRLGIEMEVHGNEEQYTRITGTPEDLIKDWSKRDVQINDTAARFGVTLQGNAGLHSAIQRLTRTAKDHSLQPEARHAQWTEHATAYIHDIPAFIESITDNELQVTDEQKLEIAARLAAIPADLTRFQSVFKYTDLVEKAANAAAGLLSREQRQRMLQLVLTAKEMVELDKPDTSYDAGATLAHTRAFTAAHTIQTERSIHRLATQLTATTGFGIPEEAAAAKIEQLTAENYPVSDEQKNALRAATGPGQIAIIEGAAGSGKTTTLRPIADLYRERGHDIIATSVSWRVTLELGTDLEAPNWCVDKLNAGMATGRIHVGPRTVIVVDEAGQLSSIQALKILEMAKASGAKVIFAGDTQQQQPVEAGPGLRLIRDVAGATRVDTIRRQKADVEDILVAFHGADRETARLRAETAAAGEKQKILDEFDALPDKDKAGVRPWQVVASEQFRDGETEAAIAAYHSRGRVHIDANLVQTFDHLIGDWDRLRNEHPDKTSAVIAYSKAEVKTLSHLMRERVLEGYDGPRHTILACRSREPRAKPEALEIAVGDIIRTGAAQFNKQLFNGTHLEVLALREDRPSLANPGVPRLLIRGRTDRGRVVEFHHDEIRDYHGKIRLDYGYAMTMNASQGLTVDRAFVFANQKPSRETIYPAMTRHRERLDVYVDRKPVELDVRHQRSEDIAGDPVTNQEILAYLARNWSRSKQKEAAQDYMTDEMRNRVLHPEGAETTHTAEPRAPAPNRTDPEGLTAPQWLTANDAGDGRLSDIAARIRYSEIQVKHGLAARTLGQACRALNASLSKWDQARQKKGNAAVALDPGFRKDLRETAAILRTVKPFLRKDPLHARVLREHGGIEISDIETLVASQRRARSIRVMSTADRRDLDPDFTPARRPKMPEHAAAEEAGRALQTLQPEISAPPIETSIEPPADLWEGWDQRHGEPEFDTLDEFGHDDLLDHDIAPDRPPLDVLAAAGELPQADTPSRDDSVLTAEQRAAFLEQSWNRHCADANQAGQHPFAAPGWHQLHQEMRELAALPDLADNDRARLVRSLDVADTWLSLHYAGKPDQRDRSPDADVTDSARTPAELIDNHRHRLHLHCEAAAGAGVHPFDAAGWAALEDELRGFLDLPRISQADRLDVADELDNIDTTKQARANLDIAVAPAHESTPDRTAMHLYNENRKELDLYMQNVLDPAQPPDLDFKHYDRLKHEGLALLDVPGLPTEARLDLIRTYDPRRYYELQQPAQPARQPEPAAAAKTDRYAAFDAVFGKHVDSAAERGLHPYETPGWRDVADSGRRLLETESLTPRQQANLLKVLDNYRVWSEARHQDHHEHTHDQSEGFGF